VVFLSLKKSSFIGGVLKKERRLPENKTLREKIDELQCSEHEKMVLIALHNAVTQMGSDGGKTKSKRDSSVRKGVASSGVHSKKHTRVTESDLARGTSDRQSPKYHARRSRKQKHKGDV
jgi:hypothetical protein